jgi:hypothetical protein
MFPPYSGNKVMTDAWLLDHQQMVQREIRRQRWASAAAPSARTRPWSAGAAWLRARLTRRSGFAESAGPAPSAASDASTAA